MAHDAPVDDTTFCFNQETDPVVCELELTRMAVKNSYSHFMSWRAFAQAYDLPHNILYAIANEKWKHVSWETLRLVRRRLGLPDPGPLAQTLACPTCGTPHLAGDCHGQPIAAVVLLAPGESVKRPGKQRTRKRYHRPCMDDAKYAAYLEFKAQYKGGTT